MNSGCPSRWWRTGLVRLALLVLVAAGLRASTELSPASSPTGSDPTHPAVIVARVAGPIGPATADYLDRVLTRAARDGATCVVVELDTPGGLLDSTKSIVQSFLVSPVPVVVYVAPAGATATSAGCFIALAADVAAMSPTSSIGAAHPVALGGGPGEEAKTDDTMKRKIANYAASYLETIAQRRNRNVAWARAAVHDSASVPAAQALELGVIDLLAADRAELLAKLHGRVLDGRTLRTAGAPVVELAPTLRERFFQRLWRPEVMFVLMLVALYGLLGELSNPGAILPGVAGAIALVLALYLGAVLPINLAGVVLLVLAVGLFVADVFAPTHGVLTVGGVVAFVLGGLMLFDRDQPAFRLSLAFILPAAAVTAAFFLAIVGAGLRAQLLPVRTGREALLGRVVTAESPIGADGGRLFVEGESWRAVSAAPVAPGQPVAITGIDGLTLHVQPVPR